MDGMTVSNRFSDLSSDEPRKNSMWHFSLQDAINAPTAPISIIREEEAVRLSNETLPYRHTDLYLGRPEHEER